MTGFTAHTLAKAGGGHTSRLMPDSPREPKPIDDPDVPTTPKPTDPPVEPIEEPPSTPGPKPAREPPVEVPPIGDPVEVPRPIEDPPDELPAPIKDPPLPSTPGEPPPIVV